jgi:hypothetical protein
MFSFTTIFLALFAAVTVSGLSIPADILLKHRMLAARTVTAPASYATGYLEPYATYHLRYLALACENQHNSTFFATCCHPLLATEDISSRPAECQGTAAGFASASSIEAAAPTSTDDEGCDEPAATPTTTKAVANVAPTPKIVSSSKKATKTTSTKKASSTKAASSGQTFSGGVATFFTQNGVAGACGKVHSDNDLICAIDQARYGNSGDVSSLCGKQIEITASNGKTVTVTVADDCPTCINSNSIDLSVGAFKHLASEATGEVPITWKFV